MWHRREIGGIGLDQQPIGRQAAGDCAQRLGAAEGQDAREGDIEAERDADLGQPRAGRETVQDRREGTGAAFLFEDRDHVVIGVAGMDDERKVGDAGRCDMPAKAHRLQRLVLGAIDIVETRLPDRDHLRMLRQGDEFLRRDVRLLMGAVRMCADRAIDRGVAFGDGADLVEAAHARRDGHHEADAGRVCVGDQAVAVLIEIGKIEMAVAVDEHGIRGCAERWVRLKRRE